MKKIFVIGVLLSLAVGFSLVWGINSSEASPEIGQAQLESSSLLPGQSQEPVPMAECAKIECGTCPGPNCKIDGICCYVPNSTTQPGLASCGCTASGEPVCKCDVGVPR